MMSTYRAAVKKSDDKKKHVAKLKADLRRTKNEPEQDKGGGVISKWATTWLNSKAVTSKVYHGGDWEGNSCRRFLLHDSKPAKFPIYSIFITELVKKIEAETTTVTGTKETLIATLIAFLTGTFKTLCEKLAPVVKALSTVKAFEDDESDAARSACKDYVSYYRSQLMMR